MKCPYCSKPLPTNTTGRPARFCSDTCRKLAHKSLKAVLSGQEPPKDSDEESEGNPNESTVPTENVRHPITGKLYIPGTTFTSPNHPIEAFRSLPIPPGWHPDPSVYMPDYFSNPLYAK